MISKLKEVLKKKIGDFSGYLLILFVLVLSLSLYRNLSRIKRSNQEIKRVEQKVENLEGENEELQDKLEIVKSEEYVEKQLRDKLGLAKEGEIVVVLPEEEILRRLAPEIDEEEDVLPDPNWKKWAKLFL